MRYYVKAAGGDFLVTCVGVAGVEGRNPWRFWHRRLRAVFGSKGALYPENLPGFKAQGRPVTLLWTGVLVEPEN